MNTPQIIIPHRYRLKVIIAGFLIAVTGFSQSAEPGIKELLLEAKDEAKDEARSREVPLKVYLTEKSLEKQPVILFSHGLGGSREGSAFLGKHWAKAGYVAVFLQHPGSDESIWKDVPPAERRKSFQSAASAKSFIDRVGDVKFVLDQLERWNGEAKHPLSGRMDLDHVGMSGHSFGAVTTQAVMGQKVGQQQPFHDTRLDAFILMSPSPPAKGSVKAAYGHIDEPIFCMTGTKDESMIGTRSHVTPESRQTVYPDLKDGGKYHVVFKDGEHFVFSGSSRRGRKRDPRYHPAILKLTTAFWDAHLKDDKKVKEWMQSKKAREVLIDEDVYEWK